MQCGPIRHEIADQTTFTKHLIVHPTAFTTEETGDNGVSFQALYGELAADAAERAEVRTALDSENAGPTALLAIDKVAGEGFDAARLNGLSLTSPFRFKGKIQQVGHRQDRRRGPRLRRRGSLPSGKHAPPSTPRPGPPRVHHPHRHRPRCYPRLYATGRPLARRETSCGEADRSRSPLLGPRQRPHRSRPRTPPRRHLDRLARGPSELTTRPKVAESGTGHGVGAGAPRTRRNRHYSQSPPSTSLRWFLLMISRHACAHPVRIPMFPQGLLLTITRSLHRHGSAPAGQRRRPVVHTPCFPSFTPPAGARRRPPRPWRGRGG